MQTIDRDSLKQRLADGDDFKLVMTLPDWAFRAAHIPGSLNIASTDELVGQLDVDDDIVVYCSDAACIASQLAYRELDARGYQHVVRYEGGLSDWTDAGYPLEGTGFD